MASDASTLACENQCTAVRGTGQAACTSQGMPQEGRPGNSEGFLAGLSARLVFSSC